jgi:Flp pilus assembly protein TadG
MAPLTRRWSEERGAEVVEFAVVLPLLLLVLMGIIDFGMLFQRYHVVTNAAREGARVAVLPGYSTADVQERVDQFLTAAGLTDPATTTVDPPETLEVGGQCIVVSPVTVEYPYTYSAVGAVASYFDGSGFSRSGLQATVTMRNELSASTCVGP